MSERERLVNEWARTLHAMVANTGNSRHREPFITATLALLDHLFPARDTASEEKRNG